MLLLLLSKIFIQDIQISVTHCYQLCPVVEYPDLVDYFKSFTLVLFENGRKLYASKTVCNFHRIFKHLFSILVFSNFIQNICYQIFCKLIILFKSRIKISVSRLSTLFFSWRRRLWLVNIFMVQCQWWKYWSYIFLEINIYKLNLV